MSVSSARWLKEHHRDPYVKAAKAQGYRSRAAFKLTEILKRDPIIKPGMIVLDVGASPGGWCQVIWEALRGQGQVVAIDKLPCDPLPGVDFWQADFTDPACIARLQGTYPAFDVITSDMAPNFSGTKTVDQLRAGALCDMVWEAVPMLLKPGGALLMKMFHSAESEACLKTMRSVFRRLCIRKPPASRGRSGEFYVLGLFFQQQGTEGAKGVAF